jgi:phospholipid/cholesterol/gamma-HCH transport system permease protein
MDRTPAKIDIDVDKHILYPSGDWSLSGIQKLSKKKPKLKKIRKSTQITVNGRDLEHLDSAGAWLLWDLMQRAAKGINVNFENFTNEQQTLLHLVENDYAAVSKPLAPTKHPLSFLENVGKETFIRIDQGISFLAFIGEVLLRFIGCIRNPRCFEWRSFLNVIDSTGFRALPIVGLLSFSIGVVLAYQMGQQLKLYGANIFIVSMLGLGILQEFAPLITAIIIAGRTSSSFTAEIGSMKINEEIDALSTMGLSPVERLALPKILGLLIALPLLIVWADIFGIIGGMIISKHQLHISYYSFIMRFPIVVELSTFLYGLLKAPFFAAIISGVGCFQGFQVGYSAEDLGRRTTKSVVQAIFWIIITDSLFSIILPWQSIQ